MNPLVFIAQGLLTFINNLFICYEKIGHSKVLFGVLIEYFVSLLLIYTTIAGNKRSGFETFKKKTNSFQNGPVLVQLIFVFFVPYTSNKIFF
jgi:hypothetical protein